MSDPFFIDKTILLHCYGISYFCIYNIKNMLHIPHILATHKYIHIQEVKENLLQHTESINIDVVNWHKEFPDCPVVKLYIGYNQYFIFLHYSVKEKYTKARVENNNGEVWTDSCVEFFISWDNDISYYNFETNCIGKCLLGFTDKEGNKYRAENQVLDKIKIESSLGSMPFNERTNEQWHITIAIPVACFYRHQNLDIQGKQVHANFYKCGDSLSTPHFLSWTNIDTPNPSFHQPLFFGEIVFKK